MKGSRKVVLLVACIFSFMFLAAYHPSISVAAKGGKQAKAAAKVDPLDAWQAKPNAAYDAGKMGNMSDFDPGTMASPSGDTIKIAVVASFSGPGAWNGQIFWHNVQWAAYDVNKRGGIFVDGKKKLIEVIKADHMSKADQCKKVCERMVLQEKVHVLWGTDGSNMMRIINEVANKYKVIAVNAACLADSLMDATNFGRYAFQASWSTEQVGRSFAYYYGQIRKKEKKFYIFCQDYSFGHEIAEGFKKGLKEYYPEAQIVGEDYHKLFLTDFAPYMEKIKASGAEVIYTGDWDPDAGNMLKQSRQMNLMLPIANIYMDNPNNANEVGIQGSKGLTNLSTFLIADPQFRYPGYTKMYKAWAKQWETKWKTPPYNSKAFSTFGGNWGSWTGTTYWLLSVIERAKSTDAEKIIKVWEGDTYRLVNGKVLKMRACDHKAIQDLAVSEFVPAEQQKVSMNIPPYYWHKEFSFWGPTAVIPASKALPWMDQKLDRCKSKSDWGE